MTNYTETFKREFKYTPSIYKALILLERKLLTLHELWHRLMIDKAAWMDTH